MADLEDKYSRFFRYTNIDLQAEIAAGGGESGLENYYTKTETDDLLDEKASIVDLDSLDDRVVDLEATPVDLSDTPRFLLYNSGWPARGNSSRATFFIGGDPNDNQPTDINLVAGDLWIPFGGGIV